MSGTDADPETLEAVASKLRNASTDLKASASPPPKPEVGVVTDVVHNALGVLTNALGNTVTDVGALGDSVAKGRDLYVETDYEQAAQLKSQQAQDE